MADDGPLTNLTNYDPCVEGGDDPTMNGVAAMSPEYHGEGRGEGLTRERAAKLREARGLLAAALELLDDHARSPAAANVDLAIHQIDAELAQ